VTILRLISFNSNSNLLLYMKEEKRNKGERRECTVKAQD
jgi:hypothetical protein